MMRDPRGMKLFLRLVSLVFALVVLGHALRLAFDWPITLAGWTVPMWLSWVAIVVAGALSLWAFSLSDRVRRF